MVIILSRDSALYSTQSLVAVFSDTGRKVLVLDVLRLEVKVGKGVFFQGQKLSPTLVIPRLSSQPLVAGLSVLREWEAEGVSVVNPSAAIAIANDQLATLQCLSAKGIPVPETSFCSQPSEGDYDSILGDSPKVIKLLDSSQGKGVTLAKDYLTGKSVLSTLSALRSSGVTQRYYKTDGRDYRVIVLKGKVITAIERQSQGGDFRANLHQGGTAYPIQPSDEICDIALRATSAVGLDFAGVDLLPTPDGYLVIELNASPGLQGVDAGEEGRVARALVGAYS